MLPQKWNLAVIGTKDFFQIPLDPADAPRFAFSVPSINQGAPMKGYHWKVLHKGMKNSPSICQQYVAPLLSPEHAKVREAIILHCMDDVLVCAPDDDTLQHVLDLFVSALIVAGFKLQTGKVQLMPLWRYLGLQIKRIITPQKLTIRNNPKTSADLHQLCGSLSWVRP